MFQKRLCVLALGVALVLACSTAAPGKVLFEYWFDIGGVSVNDNLRTACSFPDGPSQSELLDALKSPADWKDNYGLRARAYLTPAADGDYTFWVSGDDNCQLWLSTDDTAANATMIAQVAGWTGVEEWGKEAGQKSAPIALKAGQKYYIEMLLKEGGGGDSITAAWGGPGIGDGPVVIAGGVLTEYVRTSFPAVCPNPASGTLEVVSPLFQWKAAANGMLDDIYFGTNPNPGFMSKQPSAMALYFYPMPLEPGATYYWRVDTASTTGVLSTGTVWSFTVMPLKAHFQSPPDGAANAPLDVQLSWAAGQNVLTHDVYFGTDKAAVAAGDAGVAVATGQEDTSFDPSGLEPVSTYYWRVDEHDASGNLVVGDVWSFSSIPAIAGAGEPNLVGWWTFDTEPANSMTVLDMSGNNHHGTLVGGGITFEDDPDMGGVLSLPGGNGKYVSIGGVGISGNMPTTIACWAKADHTSIPDWTLVFGFTTTGGGCGSHFNIDSIGGPGGVGAHAWCFEETIFTDQQALEWHHYAMTYDGTTIAYYGDGAAMDTDVAKSNVVNLAIRGDNVHIGKRITQESSFPGKVDDARIYNRALTPNEIRALGSNVLLAWDPQPANGATLEYGEAVALTWQPGDEAVAHDVFLGTDADLVAAGDPNVLQGRVDVPSFALPADLAGDQTYYWRIDEINGAGDVTAGSVWSFTVRPMPVGPQDVTQPGDAVQGVPNDMDWPIPNEVPANAIDNSSSTKFLHFKGELLPTGIQVTPAVGSTIVTGLTFTTANDSPGRDPVKFELSGSNDSIDGPWTVIAAGDIVDFAQATAADRYTMNSTPITFENSVAYKHYQIVFPALRNPVTDPMMQIAEIELLGTPATVEFADDFESYAAGSGLHGQGGWKGWGGDANAGAPASNEQAFSGANSVKIIGSADLVHEFAIKGGKVIFSAMQYIPTGATGTTYFILMNVYNDPGTGLDWSVQTEFKMTEGTVGALPLVRDKWVEVKCLIDLDENTVSRYYDGKLIGTEQWDDNVHGTLQAIDLYGNNASPVYYDDITVTSLGAPKRIVYDFETGAQGWGNLKDGTAVAVSSETHSAGGSQSLRVTINEAANGQQEGGWASSRDFTVDDAAGGLKSLSFWYRVDDPDLNGGNIVCHWIVSTEAWSGGGWYGNGLWGVLIADGQWHQQTFDLSILGANAGGWEGVWGDLPAWEFSADLFYSFEISFGPTDNTNGSNMYIDDIVFE